MIGLITTYNITTILYTKINLNPSLCVVLVSIFASFSFLYLYLVSSDNIDKKIENCILYIGIMTLSTGINLWLPFKEYPYKNLSFFLYYVGQALILYILVRKIFFVLINQINSRKNVSSIKK